MIGCPAIQNNFISYIGTFEPLCLTRMTHTGWAHPFFSTSDRVWHSPLHQKRRQRGSSFPSLSKSFVLLLFEVGEIPYPSNSLFPPSDSCCSFLPILLALVQDEGTSRFLGCGRVICSECT
jgi:hypothetical protein